MRRFYDLAPDKAVAGSYENGRLAAVAAIAAGVETPEWPVDLQAIPDWWPEIRRIALTAIPTPVVLAPKSSDDRPK